MKRVIRITLTALFIVITPAFVNRAVSAPDDHHPAPTQGAVETEAGMPGQTMPGMVEMMEMMRQGKGMMKKEMPRIQPSSPSARMHMMSEALSGRMMMDPAMMKSMMNRKFFLDCSGELGLTQSQVADIKTIRADCRKDNIRTGAEVKIARLELDDLLDEDVWSLKEAEKLIRHIEKLEADIMVRHLQAMKQAEKVLTEEQREKARKSSKSMPLEELF